MRNTSENTDGINKVMLATAAIALLIPPIVMVLIGPQQKGEATASSQLTISPKIDVTAPEVPSASDSPGIAPVSPANSPYAPGANASSVEVASAEVSPAGE